MNKYVSFRLWNMHAVLLFCCVVFGVYYRLCLYVGLIHAYTYRDQSVYAPSPWKTTLHCNVVSHWLGVHTKRFLYPVFFHWHWGNPVTTIKSQQKQQNAKVVHNSHHQTSNIKGTKSQNANVSRLVLQLSLPKPLTPGVKSRRKI